MLRVPLAATAVALLLVALVLAGGYAGGARKLAALEPVGEARGSYAITLDFAPERFHQQVMQERGRVVGVKERTVFIMDVEPAALREIARRYWVASVERWKPS
jgi:hypothetical protein